MKNRGSFLDPQPSLECQEEPHKSFGIRPVSPQNLPMDRNPLSMGRNPEEALGADRLTDPGCVHK